MRPAIGRNASCIGGYCLIWFIDCSWILHCVWYSTLNRWCHQHMQWKRTIKYIYICMLYGYHESCLSSSLHSNNISEIPRPVLLNCSALKSLWVKSTAFVMVRNLAKIVCSHHTYSESTHTQLRKQENWFHNSNSLRVPFLHPSISTLVHVQCSTTCWIRPMLPINTVGLQKFVINLSHTSVGDLSILRHTIQAWMIYRISSIRRHGYYLYHCSFCAATIQGRRLFLWKAWRHQRRLDTVQMSEMVTVARYCQ